MDDAYVTGRNEFYNFSRDSRWVSSAESLDITQIGHRLSMAVKDYFPMNEVPTHIVNICQHLAENLLAAENTIDFLFEEMNKEMKKRAR